MFLGPVVLASTLRLTTPILLVALGGSFGHKAKVLNIGLESFMLISAFFSMLGSYMYGSAFVGLLFGIASAIISSLVFGFFVLYLHSNPVIVGIALNTAAWGITTFLLDTIFNVRGVFIDQRIESFKNIKLPIINDIPFIGQVVSNQNILVYFAFIIAIVLYIIMYKTRFGLRLRGVGIKPTASETVGISSQKYKWIAIFISGIFAGIGGAYLSIGGSSMFTESMSAGKGFLALAAIMVADGNPLFVMFISLIFGYTSALSVALQSLGIPSQIVLTTPYVITVIILVLYAIYKNTDLYLKPKSE
jgi:simple sugar transport system permease protein